MASQSRLHSLQEALVNVVLSYAVAFLLQLYVFPLFGVHVPLSANLALSGIMTVISTLRIYLLRRWFNSRI